MPSSKCLPTIFTRGGLHPLIGAADFFYCCPVVRSNFCWPSKDLVLSSLGTPSTLDLIYAAVPHTDRPPHPISSTNPPPKPLALSISSPLSPPTPDLSSSVRPEIPGKTATARALPPPPLASAQTSPKPASSSSFSLHMFDHHSFLPATAGGADSRATGGWRRPLSPFFFS